MESGSIQEVAERLQSWCVLHERGFARVEWDSAYARQDVVGRLKGSLNAAGIAVVETGLPSGGRANETVVELIEKLRSLSGSVVSITGIEWAFPEGGNPLEPFVAVSFKREILASIPVRQIWWVPSTLTERFVLGVPDLDSWFRLRLHLTEVPPRSVEAFRGAELSSRAAVSVDEARALARRFWERLDRARSQNTPEDRIWTELAQPAVEALQSAGLEREADEILARTSNARGALERKLKELIEARGPDDAEVLSLTARLARLLLFQGDLAGARRLQERVLESRMRALGEEHPDTLKVMNSLAVMLEGQGDLASGRQLHERVLEVRRRVLGEEHPDTLASMSNLALTLAQQGDLAGARRLNDRLLEVRRRVLGEEHPDTLLSTSNLAATLGEWGDLAGAQRLDERVLEVRRRLLGEGHPDTLKSMNNLAATLHAQGDLAGARRLEERALEVSQRVLGEKHPDTLRLMYNMARLLSEGGDSADAAVPLLRKCLLGRCKVLGENHPDTIATAELLKRVEALSEAKQ